MASNPQTESAVLAISNVSKSYGNNKALDDVSFDLPAGFHALLGSNGAGKSTLFQLLTGLFVADEGEIHIAGINIQQHLTQVLAKTGVVFQQSSLDLDLTVQSNLDFYGQLHGMSKNEIRTRSSEELEKVGLGDVNHTKCRTLSGGNRRKIELARALLTQPDILFMDEATVGLDPASRDTLLEYVHSLCQQRNLCVLWATHLIDEAEHADQVLILNKGRLLAQGSPYELITQTQQQNLLDAFFKFSGQKPSAKPTSV